MATVQSHEQTTATCILCQDTGEVTAAAAGIPASEGKVFVLSVSVQRSSVLRRSEQDINNGKCGMGLREHGNVDLIDTVWWI